MCEVQKLTQSHSLYKRNQYCLFNTYNHIVCYTYSYLLCAVDVLDNVGLELVTDLCLAEWLLNAGLADCVHFHCKQLPWFVSDALKSDFNWTLQQMAVRG